MLIAVMYCFYEAVDAPIGVFIGLQQNYSSLSLAATLVTIQCYYAYNKFPSPRLLAIGQEVLKAVLNLEQCLWAICILHK